MFVVSGGLNIISSRAAPTTRGQLYFTSHGVGSERCPLLVQKHESHRRIPAGYLIWSRDLQSGHVAFIQVTWTSVWSRDQQSHHDLDFMASDGQSSLLLARLQYIDGKPAFVFNINSWGLFHRQVCSGEYWPNSGRVLMSRASVHDESVQPSGDSLDNGFLPCRHEIRRVCYALCVHPASTGSVIMSYLVSDIELSAAILRSTHLFLALTQRVGLLSFWATQQHSGEISLGRYYFHIVLFRYGSIILDCTGYEPWYIHGTSMIQLWYSHSTAILQP